MFILKIITISLLSIILLVWFIFGWTVYSEHENKLPENIPVEQKELLKLFLQEKDYIFRKV